MTEIYIIRQEGALEMEGSPDVLAVMSTEAQAEEAAEKVNEAAYAKALADYNGNETMACRMVDIFSVQRMTVMNSTQEVLNAWEQG